MTEHPPGPEPAATDEARATATTRDRLLRLARLGYVGLLVVLVGYTVATRWDDIVGLLDGTRPGWLGLAFVLALGQLLPSVLVWTTATRRLGDVDVPVRGVALATARSVPTRYLPGSVWYALGRAALLRRDFGVSRRVLGTAAALETMLAVVVAIAGGSALLAIAGRLPSRPLFLALWFGALAVAASPPAINRVLAFVESRRGGADRPSRLGWGTWGRLVSLTGLHWLWSATTFTVYLQAFPNLQTNPIVEVAGAFLIAWVVGFLAVFAPQGAGAFEFAVAAMLVGSGAGSVAVVVGGYRAMMVVRDVVVFSAAGIAGRRDRPVAGP